MRPRKLAALSLLLSMALPAAAQAASLDLASEFTAVCAANRLDSTKAISAARARGFAIQSGPETAKLGTVTILTREVDGKRWAVRVAMSGVAPSPTHRGQTILTCTVGGQDAGKAAVDPLARWAGVPPLTVAEGNTTYAFREEDGRHQPLASNDDAGVQLAMDAGGVYVLQLTVTGSNAVATLSRSQSGF